ncbi:hypothetical protein GCM10009599_06670 [Luteococcus peritonei]
MDQQVCRLVEGSHLEGLGCRRRQDDGQGDEQQEGKQTRQETTPGGVLHVLNSTTPPSNA